MNTQTFGIVGILSFLLLGSSFSFGYYKGTNTQKNKQNEYIQKQKSQYEKLYILKQQQNESLAQLIVKQNIDRKAEYNDIQKELNKSNANLATCKLNNNSLLELQRAANRTIRSNTTRQLTNQSAGKPTNNKSEIDINCRDLSITMVKWSEMYFQAKDQADGWKKWYRHNFLDINGKSYISDK